MRSLWLEVLFMTTCIFVSSGAAYAGPKHFHNMDVKAQCAAKTDAENLTGHARHDAIKQCKQEGMSYAHRF